MSHWVTLHANLESSSENFDADDIAESIGKHTDRDPNVRLHSGSLYVCLFNRDTDVLKEWAEQHADRLDKVGIGRGNDTGPGNDSVQFYDTDDGTLERDMRRRDCPTGSDGLRIESTR